MTEESVMLRVVLVDDHPVVRAGLRAVLESGGGISVVAEAEDSAQALAAVDRQVGLGEGPDVVVMDIELGGGPSGIETTRQLAQRHPRLPVLMVTTYSSSADVQSALQAGAVGYLLKDASAADLRDAVVKAAQGMTVLPAEIARRALGGTRGLAEALSPREVQILELLATGRTNQQLAAELFISQATVKTHLNHIFGKLGVVTRTEAVAAARQHGIIRG
ncbi:response regulator [Micrococcus sp. IITD107]|uniref:response regulator n=1 Tax=Micrococcus sp. IITD107 TaxID=3342790 RepID=UPI0035B82658